MQTTALKRTKDILWVVSLAGLLAGLLRFSLGLGVTTGLNDATPWGFWIALKLGFVALSGGGFTLAAIVYIFHLETYRPLVHRAILLALLGYGSFIVSLIFDLGLPWHIYMPVIHWQHHSVMFEIAWCVMLYFTVLVLEFSPVILEYRCFQRPFFSWMIALLHKATIPLVIAGIVLSTLHQSSLGSLFLIMPHRVHPLWYTPLIPVLFFVSAIAAGLMALIVEGYLAQILFNHPPETTLMDRIGKVGAFTLWLYLCIRLVDLYARGILPAALDGTWQSLLFSIEILVGGIVPAGLLTSTRIRTNVSGLLTGAILAIAGILNQRMALSLFTMARPSGAPYTPSVLEMIIAFAIPATAGLVYLFFIENLAVHTSRLPQIESTGSVQPVWKPGILWPPKHSLRYTLATRSGIAVLVFALTGAAFTGAQHSNELPVEPSLGWQFLTIDGDRDRQSVLFPHKEHQSRLAIDLADEDDACATCHHLSALPGDKATLCSECHRDFIAPTKIFDHTHHTEAIARDVGSTAIGNAICGECHTGEHRRSTTAACAECHTDMTPLEGQLDFSPQASGYKNAMHNRCLDCHEKQALSRNRPQLGACSNCHSSQTEQQALSHRYSASFISEK